MGFIENRFPKYNEEFFANVLHGKADLKLIAFQNINNGQVTGA